MLLHATVCTCTTGTRSSRGPGGMSRGKAENVLTRGIRMVSFMSTQCRGALHMRCTTGKRSFRATAMVSLDTAKAFTTRTVGHKNGFRAVFASVELMVVFR